MESIKRSVNALTSSYIEPICYIQATNVIPIEITFSDVTLTSGSTAMAIVRNSDGTTWEQEDCSINVNTITVKPTIDTFSCVGTAHLQIEVSNDSSYLYSVEIPVIVGENLFAIDLNDESNQTVLSKVLEEMKASVNQYIATFLEGYRTAEHQDALNEELEGIVLDAEHMITNDYDSSVAYANGDTVIYNNHLWKANKSIEAGTEWSEDDWEQTTVFESIMKVSAGSVTEESIVDGAVTIEKLSDDVQAIMRLVTDYDDAKYAVESGNALYINQFLGCLKSYYNNRADADGNYIFEYGHTTALDSDYADGGNQIDCSSFVCLGLMGIEFNDSPYASLESLSTDGNDSGSESSDAGDSYDEGSGGGKAVSVNTAYPWAIDLPHILYKKVSTELPVRTASQLCQMMEEAGWAVKYNPDFSNAKRGDVVFYAKKDDNGDWVQPNRYKHISHVAVISTVKSDGTHTMFEVTTGTKVVINSTLEKRTTEYIAVICRPQLGSVDGQDSGSILQQTGSTNIDELRKTGVYYGLSTNTGTFPDDVSSLSGCQIKVNETYNKFGRIYNITQTLVVGSTSQYKSTLNAYTPKVYVRYNNCYLSATYTFHSDYWTQWICLTSGGSVTVDKELSETSTNPVQNKVINEALTAQNEAIVRLEGDEHTHSNKSILDTISDAWTTAINWVTTNGQKILDHIANATIHVTESDKSTWSAKQDAISDLADIRSGASKGATALQSVPSTYRTASEQDKIHDATKQDTLTDADKRAIADMHEDAFTDDYKSKVDDMYTDWTATDTALTSLEGVI